MPAFIPPLAILALETAVVIIVSKALDRLLWD
jgi:hypothetical protein